MELPYRYDMEDDGSPGMLELSVIRTLKSTYLPGTLLQCLVTCACGIETIVTYSRFFCELGQQPSLGKQPLPLVGSLARLPIRPNSRPRTLGIASSPTTNGGNDRPAVFPG